MSDSTPAVSVILPTAHLADGAGLARSLASLAAQTLLSDDAGTRAELLVALPEGSPLPPVPAPQGRLEVRRVSPCSSQTAAVTNQLLAAARGRAVAWLQPGDSMAPERLAEGWASLEADPELAATFSFAHFEGEGGEADVACEETFNQDLDPEEFAHRMLLGNVVVTSSAMVRHSALAALGEAPVDEGLLMGHCYDLWCRLLLRGPTRTIPLPLVTCRPAAPAPVSARRVAQESWLVASRHAGNIMRRWPTMPQTNYAFFGHIIELATLSEDHQVVIDYLNLKRRAFGHDDDDCMRLVDCLVKLGRETQAISLLSTLQAERRRLAPSTVAAVGSRLAHLQAAAGAHRAHHA